MNSKGDNTSYYKDKSFNSIPKKRSNNKKNLFIIIISILIIIGTVLLLIKLTNKNNDNNTNIDPNQNLSNNDVKDDVEDPRYKELDYVNKKLSFFKDEYIDRYINYKRENPQLDIEKVIVYVNIGLDREFYTDIADSPDMNTNTVLVNKYYYLGEDYVPENLETINSKYSAGAKQMESDARIAFEAMAKDAATLGYTIRAVSTYRSYSYQTQLYSNYAKSDGTEKADTYSARAGHSEHQTGLAVDVDNAKVSYTSFGSTKEFDWMKENAYKYGFILRYTKENEFITGYKDEPWHYRYVGVEIATYIQNNPMTYEEYYVRFLEK